MKTKQMTKRMNNLPALQNPMNQLMTGGMPGLPDIFSDAFPPNLPSLSYDAGFIERKLHKWKIKDFVEIKQFEAAGAEADTKKFKANTEKIIEAATFGPKLKDAFDKYEHEQIMREFEQEKAATEIQTIQLEQEKTKVLIQQIQYQTALLANEVKLGEIEFKISEKQLNKTLEIDE